MSATDPKRPDVTRAEAVTDGDQDATPGVAPAEPDAGRHAVSRPAPTPPEPVTGTDAAPSSSSTGAARTTTGGTPDGSDGTPDGGDGTSDDRADGTPEAATRAGTRTPDDDPAPTGPDASGGSAREGLFPDPHAPRTPHLLTHLLGTLVGLVLAPAAVTLLLLGQSRVLAVQVDGWDASLELLGIVLVSAGALLVAGLLLLGVWTAAVPTTAGLVVTALGGVQLYAPGVALRTTLDVLGSDAWNLTLRQTTVAGTSGTTFTVGVLLLAGGLVVALARRHGIHLGAFRERHRVGAPAPAARGTVHDKDIQD